MQRLFQTITRSTASSSTTTVNSLDTASITSTSSFLPSSSADYNPLYSPMGCAQSSSADDKISGEQNRLIEEGLKKDKVQARSEAKMLLLGAGESGKSTILKVRILKLISRAGFRILKVDTSTDGATSCWDSESRTNSRGFELMLNLANEISLQGTIHSQ